VSWDWKRGGGRERRVEGGVFVGGSVGGDWRIYVMWFFARKSWVSAGDMVPVKKFRAVQNLETKRMDSAQWPT
jgi:hypothetical protein